MTSAGAPLAGSSRDAVLVWLGGAMYPWVPAAHAAAPATIAGITSLDIREDPRVRRFAVAWMRTPHPGLRPYGKVVAVKDGRNPLANLLRTVHVVPCRFSPFGGLSWFGTLPGVGWWPPVSSPRPSPRSPRTAPPLATSRRDRTAAWSSVTPW